VENLWNLRSVVSGFSVFVFAWQLVGAGRTFVLPKGEGPALRHLLVPLAFVLVLVLGFRLPLREGRVVPGCLGLAAALVLFEWSRRSIGRRYFSYVFSRDVPTFLWTGGPFGYVRNPFYSSYLLAALSVSFMFSGIATALPFAALFLSTRAAARLEEARFGASGVKGEYARYASRTGRFVPGVGRLRR
jgi:protein-S-isoprenylcysteine O-methyltransferase Ste14